MGEKKYPQSFITSYTETNTIGSLGVLKSRFRKFSHYKPSATQLISKQKEGQASVAVTWTLKGWGLPLFPTWDLESWTTFPPPLKDLLASLVSLVKERGKCLAQCESNIAGIFTYNCTGWFDEMLKTAWFSESSMGLYLAPGLSTEWVLRMSVVTAARHPVAPSYSNGPPSCSKVYISRYLKKTEQLWLYF